jgi:hypothetical protein
MVAKSLKMRVFFDIFRLTFDFAWGELQRAQKSEGDSAISGNRFKAFSDHPPASLDRLLQYLG